MNQYERANAARLIEGYDLRITPRKAREAEFADAQAECAKHLRAQLEHVEALTLDQYKAERKERT